jgi:hypothetical protein
MLLAMQFRLAKFLRPLNANVPIAIVGRSNTIIILAMNLNIIFPLFLFAENVIKLFIPLQYRPRSFLQD